MICKFNKKALLRRNRWVWLIFAGGVLLEIIAILRLNSGYFFEFSAITGLALASVIISLSLRGAMLQRNKRSQVLLNDDSIIMEMGKNPFAGNFDTTYIIKSIDKVEENKRAYLVTGEIVAKFGERQGFKKQIRIEKCYDHDDEIRNKLYSMKGE